MGREFILNFHGIGEPGRALETGEGDYWLTVSEFESYLGLVADLNASGRARIGLTFDDGNISDLEIALPRLLDRHMHARFFVLAGRLSDPQFLSPAALKQLRHAGMTVGTHGVDHVDWRHACDAQLHREIWEGRQRLAASLGEAIDEVAVPYGNYDHRVLRRLKQAGFAAIYTSDGGPCLPGWRLRPRICLRRDMNLCDIRRIVTGQGGIVSDRLQHARLLKRRLFPAPLVANGQGPVIASENPPSAPYELSIDDKLDHDGSIALWHDAQTATVFNHPAWWRAAQHAYGAKRRLIVLSLRQSGRLCAYWPLWVRHLGPKDGFVRIIEPLGLRMSDYNMPLVRTGEPLQAVMEQLVRPLPDQCDARTMFLWSRAIHVEEVKKAIERGFASRRFLVHRREQPTLRMGLAASYEELEKRWKRPFRAEIRRCIRRLEEKGTLSLVVAQSRDDILARLPALFEMHRVQWHSRGAPSDFDSRETMAFYRTLAESLPMELLHVSELRLDARVISSEFDFNYGGVLRGYKSAYDVACSPFSPGKVHMALLADWGIKNGLTAIDFMEGLESYKLKWADAEEKTVTHAVSRKLAFPIWAWNTKVRKLIVEYKI